MRPSVLCVLALLVCAAAPAAEKYSGPRPEKPDIPYLVHADTLIPTEASEAKEETRKDESSFTVPGAGSPVRTPMAEPVFLFLSEKIQADSLQLYRLEVKNGGRQVVLSQKRKGGPRPLRLMVTRLDDKLYKLEVNEGIGLENGEYSLTPNGSNAVFCFQVY
jgi:hypothetical protein